MKLATPLPKIIALVGKARAGKDTAGDYLIKKYGFKQLRFAEPVYKLAREYFGMEGKDRDLLAALAMHMRDIDKNVWLRKLEAKIESDQFYVITDTRFENEYEFLKDKALLVRVEADKEERKQREGYLEEYENHDTETRILTKPVHFVVENNEDIPSYLNKIDFIMDWFMDGEYRDEPSNRI